jgi:DNA-binding IclR family transcriptional regulator
VLRVLAPHIEGLTVAELHRETRLEESTLHGALATLEQHDVVEQKGEMWQYRVELMRRWVMHSMLLSHRATENPRRPLNLVQEYSTV